MASKKANRYSALIEHVFVAAYKAGSKKVTFDREELETAAAELEIKLPKNLGDIVYSFKYRNALPEAIRKTSPSDREWVIVNRGRGKYAFELRSQVQILPDPQLITTKIPDATPGVVERYALGDEQALLARLRYNRLLDIFTGVACYSLQNHLRTTVKGIGQVETDELYVGVDKHGAHYVFPVQAKGGNDKLAVVQIEQDFAMCSEKFPELVCRSVAAQFMKENVIALFELALDENGEVKKVSERHYHLVPQSELTDEEIAQYRERAG